MVTRKPYVPSKKVLNKIYPTKGLSYKKPDNSRLAMPPGWRKSKSTGKWYFENRKNRSDSNEDRHIFIENMTGYVKRGNNISIVKSPLPNHTGYIIVMSTVAGRPLFYLNGVECKFNDDIWSAKIHKTYETAKKDLDLHAAKFNWTATKRKIKVKFPADITTPVIPFKTPIRVKPPKTETTPTKAVVDKGTTTVKRRKSTTTVKPAPKTRSHTTKEFTKSWRPGVKLPEYRKIDRIILTMSIGDVPRYADFLEFDRGDFNAYTYVGGLNNVPTLTKKENIPIVLDKLKKPREDGRYLFPDYKYKENPYFPKIADYNDDLEEGLERWWRAHGEGKRNGIIIYWK